MAMGRKVVVFHDYNQGGGFNPFDMNERAMGKSFRKAAIPISSTRSSEFKTEFKDLIGSDLFKASSPIANFQKQFPGVLLVNGLVPAKTRRENVARFQDDASPQLILVQSQAGKEGISLHDTTGKHQRVLFNLGQPTQPTMAMQQEGRIYRMGQVTDAIIRYLNTGTNWERWAFATTIAQRASAAENLGSGELARALGIPSSAGSRKAGTGAGMEDEGKGGKARDAAANNALSESTTGPRRSTSERRRKTVGPRRRRNGLLRHAGADRRRWSSSPTSGQEMMFWSRPPGMVPLRDGFLSTPKRTAIEPSTALRSRLAMVFEWQHHRQQFRGS